MNSRTYGDQPAFPVTPAGEAFTETDGQSAETHMHATAQHYGVSKRELFAGLAMMGFAADSEVQAPVAKVAEHAVGWADALCAELARGAQE